jgi:hypothetical protein
MKSRARTSSLETKDPKKAIPKNDLHSLKIRSANAGRPLVPFTASICSKQNSKKQNGRNRSWAKKGGNNDGNNACVDAVSRKSSTSNQRDRET